MSSPIIPPIQPQQCGCCARRLPADDGDALWCRDCARHVSQAGRIEERTYRALQGRECPFAWAPANLDDSPVPWFTAKGLNVYHLSSALAQVGNVASWCMVVNPDVEQVVWNRHPPVEVRCRACTRRLARVLAERVMQESMR